jgi:putative phosphoribosyl transferase
MFRDRLDAGRRLGAHLLGQLQANPKGVVVLGIPRGGVVVGGPVAEALQAKLDVVVPRKIGAPDEPELAIGAIALSGDDEIVLLDEPLIRRLGVASAYLKAETARQRLEIERRVIAYREGRPPAELGERTAVVVDDGIATGFTARAAVKALERSGPREVVLAAPVCPPDTLETFRREGIRLEVLVTPEHFMAVGQFYDQFAAAEDAEVREVLRRHAEAM